MSMEWSKVSSQDDCPDDMPELLPPDVVPTTPPAAGSDVPDPSPCSAPRKPEAPLKRRRLSLPKGAGAGAGAPAPAPGSMVPCEDEGDMDDNSVHDAQSNMRRDVLIHVHDNDRCYRNISSVDSTGGQASSTAGVFSELDFSQGEPTSPSLGIMGRTSVVPAAQAAGAAGSLFSQESDSMVQFPSPSNAFSPMYLSIPSRMSTDGSAAGGSQDLPTDASMATMMSPRSASSPTSSSVLPVLSMELHHPIVQPISAVSVLSHGENVPLTTPTWPTFGPGVHERVQRAAVHMQQRCVLGLSVLCNPSLESSDDLLASLPSTSGD